MEVNTVEKSAFKQMGGTYYQQAEHMLSQLVKQIAEQEGITEHLKSADQMGWIRQMNNVRERAIEVINAELIY